MVFSVERLACDLASLVVGFGDECCRVAIFSEDAFDGQKWSLSDAFCGKVLARGELHSVVPFWCYGVVRMSADLGGISWVCVR